MIRFLRWLIGSVGRHGVPLVAANQRTGNRPGGKEDASGRPAGAIDISGKVALHDRDLSYRLGYFFVLSVASKRTLTRAPKVMAAVAGSVKEAKAARAALLIVKCFKGRGQMT